jgi:hypothetical protein
MFSFYPPLDYLVVLILGNYGEPPHTHIAVRLESGIVIAVVNPSKS